MIDSITIKRTASYNENGIEINGLKKINFIYGANATGKTTISNLISNPTLQNYQHCSINWKHNQPIRCLVYNKHFRELNFSGSSKLKGVFTLGHATTEEIKAIEQKKNELSILKEEINKQKATLISQQNKKTEEENEFKETCWNFYKKYEDDFKEAFRGSLQKETFKTKLLWEFKKLPDSILTIDEIKSKSETIFGDTPTLISSLATISFERVSEIESDNIWSKKIIGKTDVDIAKLIQNLNMNDWVNLGREYLQENNICPFCQQETITDKFRLQIEEYFDNTFTESTKLARSLHDEYLLLITNLLNIFTQIETNEKSNPLTKLNIDKFSAYLKTLSGQIISNKELAGNKIKEPSRSLNLISTSEQFANMNQLLLDANEEIKKHNEIVNNFQTERNNLIQAIWNFVALEAKTEITNFNSKITGLQQGIDNITKQIREKDDAYKKLDIQIKILNKNVTSIQPTIDEINRVLNYYGFHNFIITPSSTEKGYYQIQRDDGSLVESTLSEGEITFITFLYFLQLTKGDINQENITEDKVLIIDDPISSLDSNVLFIVSTLIKEIIESIKKNVGNIRQIILLTHNVYFHREVSFIDGRTKENNETHFWILRKDKTISKIQPYEKKNPIQSSYRLLWQEIKDKDKHSTTNMTIQNTMRRIIENYFKILGKYGDDALIQKFETQEEQCICKSLISWINDGSHNFADDLFIEVQDNAMENYLKVFKGIFEKTNNLGHYNMMMEIENN